MLILSGIITLCSTNINAQKQPLVATIQMSSPTCYGGTNGSIVINASGGLEPYSFNWTDGSTSSSLTGIAAGTYAVLISDASGGLIGGDFVLTQPTPIQISSSINQMTNAFTQNAAINVTVTGGSPNYTYLWETINGTAVQSASEDQTNLDKGKYSLIVSDINGCQAQRDFIIKQKVLGKPNLSGQKNSSDPSVIIYPNPSNGIVNFKVDQEITKYEVYNSNGNLIETLVTNPIENNDRAMNLESGNYTVLFYGISGVVKTERLMVR
jgi:hypothetical protein